MLCVKYNTVRVLCRICMHDSHGRAAPKGDLVHIYIYIYICGKVRVAIITNINPPKLKAVISVCSCSTHYHDMGSIFKSCDDIHIIINTSHSSWLYRTYEWTYFRCVSCAGMWSQRLVPTSPPPLTTAQIK